MRLIVPRSPGQRDIERSDDVCSQFIGGDLLLAKLTKNGLSVCKALRLPATLS